MKPLSKLENGLKNSEMKIFLPIYNKVITWGKHKHAIYYLMILSFTESSFFPVPPDVLLAPMCLAKPNQAWWYATLTMITSALGGLFGYLIGMFAFAIVQPYLQEFGYMQAYLAAHHWFQIWGFWALFIAAFSPIPYKLFTIAAGTLGMPLLPFIVASLIGRGLRFFLVAGFMFFGGNSMERMLRKYVDWIGWIMVALLIGGYFVYKFK